MSKLYCEIPVSARRTVPTARAHSVGMVSVKNWSYRVEATIMDRGGGEKDQVEVRLININTSESIVLAAGPIAALIHANR
jgi:hypothetical protein